MTSPSGPPLALSTGTGQNSFPQTGAWNMLDLSKLPVQATLGILSRYSAARVNPYTALVGEVLCHNFQLTAKGRRTIEGVVNSLKVVGSLGDTLEFGFGIEDVVRSMVKSERGCVCLVLCAALMDCYSEDMAVEVLIEMANLAKVDGQYMPSSESWKELLRACAGTLSASTFPVVAEHFMQLNNERQRLGAYRGLEGLSNAYRGCSSPKSIANALLALSQISRNEMQSVTLLGGADVGWLAAIADWVLGLRTQIIQPDGKIFYANCESAQVIQVQVMYMGPDGIATDSIQTVGKSYYLDDVSKLFEEEGRPPEAAVVSGRVAWKNLLGSTFLLDFKKFMEIKHTFGELLGSAARLFKALALADKSIPYTYRLACISYCDASYGSGFVANTLRWFPELQSLKDDMQKASSVDLATARRTYEACISTIRSHCDCKTCQSSTCHLKPDVEMIPTADELQDDGNSPDNSAFGINSEDAESFDSFDDWDPDRFCLVVMAETIISTSRTLSNIVIEHESLFPVRSGLELAYGRHLNQRRAATAGRRAIKEIGPIAFCLDFDNNFSFGTQQGNEEGVEVRLHNVLELFAGRRPSSINANSSAICLNGLCAFLGILLETNEDRNSVARIHVLAGRIIFEKKSYQRLIDRIVRQDVVEANFSSALGIVTEKELYSKNSLIVRERSTGVECLFEINIGAVEAHTPVQVGPLHLAALLANRRGLVSCKLTIERVKLPGKRCGTKHSATRQLGDLEEAMARESLLEVNGKQVLALNCREAHRAVAAIASAAYLDPKYSIYIVDRECLDCCLKAALAVDRPERSHFCFFILPS